MLLARSGRARIGYEESVEHLVDENIAILPSGGDPREPVASSIAIDGTSYAVTSGTMRIDRVSGTAAGSGGDRTIHATVTLHVGSGASQRTLRGRLAVHVVSWG